MQTSTRPAYRIETSRLLIRCWEPRDAHLLDEAVRASIEHLRPWMTWARDEPKPIEDRIAFLRRARGEFDLDRDYVYGIFDLDETQVLGGTGLHMRRGPDAREIGYWIRADRTRQGLATEVTMALTRVAFEIERVRRVEIRCDPKNIASSSIPRKLAFTRKGVLHGDPDFPGADRNTEIWALAVEDYPGSPARRIGLKAFDGLNKPIAI
ncbi:MAG TPA: GNAT family protein [Anaerolineales bacterium]|nr:GNAT family protein [Anaerolineales bacterium]